MVRDARPGPAAGGGGDCQVRVGVEVDVAHPHGDVGMLFGGIVAAEGGDVGRRAVEGLQVRVGVGAGEGQFEGDGTAT
ncbi:MAG: hypothetical protein M5U01_40450 [Ardenticatenaceae bacterium]|nr:hypothetical protein [Ardenticatenaceae bacterium]HBY98235.1 hypothetical protein [Chloroflexota bacterium]